MNQLVISEAYNKVNFTDYEEIDNSGFTGLYIRVVVEKTILEVKEKWANENSSGKHMKK